MGTALHTPPSSDRSGSSSWRFLGLLLAPAALVLTVACSGGGGGGGTTNAAPVITTSPQSQTKTLGSDVTFTVAATGTPTPTYTWERSNDTGSTWAAVSGVTIASHTFTTTKADNGAQFRATATNSVSAATSSTATLTVQWLEITTQPQGQAVNDPATATFTVVPDANPAATYQWQYLGTGGGDVWTNLSGATSASFTTDPTVVGDNGIKYRCVLTNDSGSLTSDEATLTVDQPLAAPSITTNPTNQTIAANNPVTFSVAATGNPAPTFIWYRSDDGGSTYPTNVGTGANYTFTPNIADNGKRFRAVAHNTFGSDATSTAAVLTVTATTMTFTLPGAVPLYVEPIPAGSFTMGSITDPTYTPALPTATVTIGHPFYMARFECTQGQYTSMGFADPSDYGDASGTHPVENVNYDDMKTFLVALNAATTATRPAGLVFRLPTEAEWEWACRADPDGTQAATYNYYFGAYQQSDDATLSQYMWYDYNCSTVVNPANTPGTRPVGGKLPNAWNLYDLGGNVFEMCEDDWHATYAEVTTPVRPLDGTAWVAVPRVFDPGVTGIAQKGGGWNTGSNYAQSHGRAHNAYDLRDGDDGFRVVLALPLP